MGTGRSAASLARASPPPVDPVNPAAAMAGCRSSLSPACTPWIRPNVPDGAPADASAPATIPAVTSEVTGCPSCAFTTTGQPAASAEAVSPPATENANGKVDPAQVRHHALGGGHGDVGVPAVPQNRREQAQLPGGAGHLAGEPFAAKRG